MSGCPRTELISSVFGRGAPLPGFVCRSGMTCSFGDETPCINTVFQFGERPPARRQKTIEAPRACHIAPSASTTPLATPARTRCSFSPLCTPKRLSLLTPVAPNAKTDRVSTPFRATHGDEPLDNRRRCHPMWGVACSNVALQTSPQPTRHAGESGLSASSTTLCRWPSSRRGVWRAPGCRARRFGDRRP